MVSLSPIPQHSEVLCHYDDLGALEFSTLIFLTVVSHALIFLLSHLHLFTGVSSYIFLFPKLMARSSSFHLLSLLVRSPRSCLLPSFLLISMLGLLLTSVFHNALEKAGSQHVQVHTYNLTSKPAHTWHSALPPCYVTTSFKQDLKLDWEPLLFPNLNWLHLFAD